MLFTLFIPCYCCVLSSPGTHRGIRDDIEAEDDQESYFKAMANAPIILGDDEEEDWEYDEDGNPIAPERSKVRMRVHIVETLII